MESEGRCRLLLAFVSVDACFQESSASVRASNWAFRAFEARIGVVGLARRSGDALWYPFCRIVHQYVVAFATHLVFAASRVDGQGDGQEKKSAGLHRVGLHGCCGNVSICAVNLFEWRSLCDENLVGRSLRNLPARLTQSLFIPRPGRT